MTHMSNYGNDRLALYTFEAVIKFVQCWTNLQIMSVPAIQLAEKYFRMYPEESEPIWGVIISYDYYLFHYSSIQDQFDCCCYYIYNVIKT